MSRHDEIQNAYKYLGKETTFYDGMITCSTILGGAVCKIVWNMDKEAAYRETCRVLKPGGIFCGCFYIKGENKRTDWFIEKLYTPKGFFTPPYETAASLKERLESMYETVGLDTIEAMGCFICRKARIQEK